MGRNGVEALSLATGTDNPRERPRAGWGEVSAYRRRAYRRGGALLQLATGNWQLATGRRRPHAYSMWKLPAFFVRTSVVTCKLLAG
jgi:hypothetical protein